MIYLDTETCGLNGPPVLIQYAEDGGPVVLHEVWRRPVAHTLRLIEHLCEHEVCGFNLAFDWFHIQRLHNVLEPLDSTQEPSIDKWLSLERFATAGPCVKPKSALDLMLFARKGPAQALMKRQAIRIRRVPSVMAPALAAELMRTVKFDPILFHRRRGGYEWRIDTDTDPKFPDLVCSFAAAGGLKPLAQHLLGVEVIDFPVPREFWPNEIEWNFQHDDWKRVLYEHIEFWASNETARSYAVQDVHLLRELRTHFGDPPAGDVDSLLACQVASARWRGYALDLRRVKEFRDACARKIEGVDMRPSAVLANLNAQLVLPVEDTSRATLERISRIYEGDPVAAYVQQIEAARRARNLKQICDKLLTTRRAHFAFSVTGARSNRMAGTGKLNPQGIPTRGSGFRSAFLLADGDLCHLEGGDFSGFEVAIAAACYDDPYLTAVLKGGKSFHDLVAGAMYGPEYTKEQRSRAKNAVFGWFYGAQNRKLAETLNLEEAKVAAGFSSLRTEFPGIAREQERLYEAFCSMRQPDGIGSKVEWHEPQDYVESLLGFRRYFTLETRVARALFELANDPPGRLISKASVRRRDRVQTAGGAVRSALFACAFQLQASVMRQAGNHRIQSTGAELTKRLQAAIWEKQPAGIHPWRVQPLNIHDEVVVPRAHGVRLKGTVDRCISEFSKVVPLVAMDWHKGLSSWGDLK